MSIRFEVILCYDSYWNLVYLGYDKALLNPSFMYWSSLSKMTETLQYANFKIHSHFCSFRCVSIRIMPFWFFYLRIAALSFPLVQNCAVSIWNEFSRISELNQSKYVNQAAADLQNLYTVFKALIQWFVIWIKTHWFLRTFSYRFSFSDIWFQPISIFQEIIKNGTVGLVHGLCTAEKSAC